MQIDVYQFVRREHIGNREYIVLREDALSDEFWIRRFGEKWIHEETQTPYRPVYVGDELYGYTYL